VLCEQRVWFVWIRLKHIVTFEAGVHLFGRVDGGRYWEEDLTLSVGERWGLKHGFFIHI
jgi:hypothetical protein